MKKLHLGCGTAIKPGWVNVDSAALPGVDVVCDLNSFPWPWENEAFDEVFAKDLLEHLPDTVKVVEEIYRITKPGAKVYVAVPYWNSFEAITDPTHRRSFNEFTFQFFDPSHWRCRNRPYYSKARFKISKLGFVITPFKPYLVIPKLTREIVVFRPTVKWFIGLLASYFCNIIIGLEVYLERE